MLTQFRVQSRHFREVCVLFSLYIHVCVQYTYIHIHILELKGVGGDSGIFSLLLSFLFPFQIYQWHISFGFCI